MSQSAADRRQCVPYIPGYKAIHICRPPAFEAEKNVQNSRPAYKSTPHSNAWLTCRQHTVCSVASTDVMRNWRRIDCDGIDSWINQATCSWYRDDLDSSLGRAGRHSAGCCWPRRRWRHWLRRRLTINTLYRPTAWRPLSLSIRLLMSGRLMIYLYQVSQTTADWPTAVYTAHAVDLTDYHVNGWWQTFRPAYKSTPPDFEG